MRRTRSSLISVQCVILGRASVRGKHFLRALDRREHHVDRDVAIRVAVHLDAGAVHALDPRIQVVLRLGDVASVLGSIPGYGPLIAIVRSENEPSTVCSDVAPKLIHSSPNPVAIPLVIIDSRTLPVAS